MERPNLSVSNTSLIVRRSSLATASPSVGLQERGKGELPWRAFPFQTREAQAFPPTPSNGASHGSPLSPSVPEFPRQPGVGNSIAIIDAAKGEQVSVFVAAPHRFLVGASVG